MSTKVSPFMGGLGIDATSKFEVQSNATVTVGDGTNGGNVAVGDNGIISFGAGPDLQIYHDGLNSFVKDAGTGSLRILGDELKFLNAGDNQLKLTADTNGAVKLYYSGTQKVTTTATGVDVTGDIGGDTLTVSGDGTISGDVILGTNSSNTISITGSIDLGTL